MLQIVRVLDELPADLAVLRKDAAAEGRKHMDRLAEDWAQGVQRFDGPGEALLAAFIDGVPVGVCGLTQEPEPGSEPALRMRRLFVRKTHRRAGVATALVSALLQEAFDTVALATTHAGGPDAAPFWEAQGFIPVSDRPWSHEIRR